MRPLLFALVVSLAASAGAQVLPDEFPSDEPMIDRSTRELVERHRPFLSGLYAQSSLSAGPRLGQPALVGRAGGEAGYRFTSGHAVALSVAVQQPFEEERTLDLGGVGDVSGSLGLEVLRTVRRSGRGTVGAEVAIGGGASFYGDGTVGRVALTPRLVVPLTPVLAVPVGLTVAHEIGDAARPGAFVGVTVGLRRFWADRARMVLE